MLTLYLALVVLIIRAAAQDETVQVWAVYAFTSAGDKIPQYLPSADTLTPYGADQLYAAGSAFRARYVAIQDTLPGTRVEGLSAYLVDNEQINVLSSVHQSIVASAQAFMQGLYPPLDQSNETFADFSFQLANGSLATAPLGGYQYPQILTPGWGDPLSLVADGQFSCPSHIIEDYLYENTTEFWHNWEESAPFYNRLYSEALSAVFGMQSSNYANATAILEYLDYQIIHNQSLPLLLNNDEVGLARWYASQYAFATNGNSSAEEGDIRTVAGKTLAADVINAFDDNIQSRGGNRKMSFVFGNNEPMVALGSLMQLAQAQNLDFFPLPTTGASFSLELFSLESDPYPTYPDPSQLYVRFMLRNGTESPSDDSFVPYPLFGYSPSKIGIPYSEFKDEMDSFSLPSAEDWCVLCHSSATFCSGDVDGGSYDECSNGMDPVVAGVIGAVVTMVVLAILAIVGSLYCGVHTKRSHKSSSLGGFKGDQKMASDSDVTFKNPKWDDTKPADLEDGAPETTAGATVVQGHERQGSWEMRDQSPTAGESHRVEEEDIAWRSPFGDEHEDEIDIHSALQPVMPRDHL